MSKQIYLANVGRTIFMNCNNSAVIGMADTLTQATYNLTVQEEELRGGPGNPLLASTFHDQTMELSFTDALISTDMIGAMIGATKENGAKTAASAMYLHTVEITSGSSAAETMDYDYSAKAHFAPAFDLAPKYQGATGQITCYVKEADVADAEWEIAYMKAGTTGHALIYNVDDGNWKASTKYCVKMFVIGNKLDSDTTFNLNADFVPSVLHAISYIDVYEAGVAGCTGGTGTSTGSAIGQLIIDIPLFQLNNGLNLQLSTTPGTYDISGKALAAETAACTGSSRTFGKIYYCKTPTTT